MTLEEYEKVLEEKRKALQALKAEERKVDTKVFESMQQLSSKKENNEIFIKLVNSIVIPLKSSNIHLYYGVISCLLNWMFFLLISIVKGSDKDKRKEFLEKDEKAKKVLTQP